MATEKGDSEGGTDHSREKHNKCSEAARKRMGRRELGRVKGRARKWKHRETDRRERVRVEGESEGGGWGKNAKAERREETVLRQDTETETGRWA
eukprot:6212336-Pleurochrysis_carterae.AAC.3